MKEYVLDEPASPDAPPPDALPHVPATLPPQPWPWRALLVLAVVEPLALGALYLALNADGHPRARAEAAAGPATIAAFAFPSVPGQGAAAPVASEAPEESRIAFERGKYVIDLRSTDIGPALAMLAAATKATVHGADVLAREPTQLSRSAVVATPAEAWQAVLGDVASFAISCSQKGCAVFVTAAAKGDRGARLALAAPSFAPANVVGGSEMPAADPIAAAAALAAARSANGMLPPGTVPPPENGESDN